MAYDELTLSGMEDLRKKAQDKGRIISVEARVGPDLSAFMLENMNGHNFRNIYPGTVRRYADLMDKGLWMDAASTIMINKHGDTNDGQHRLAAVARSGKGQVFTFSFGHESSVKYVVDIGLPRNTAQTLAHVIDNRDPDTGKLTSLPRGIANAFRLVRRLHGNRDAGLKGEQLVAVWASDPMKVFRDNWQEAWAFLHDIDRKTGATLASLIAAYIVLLERGVPRSVVQEFFSGLAGIGVSNPHDPRFKASTLLMGENTTGSAGEDRAMKVIFHAFAKWRKGETLQKFYVPDTLAQAVKNVK